MADEDLLFQLANRDKVAPPGLTNKGPLRRAATAPAFASPSRWRRRCSRSAPTSATAAPAGPRTAPLAAFTLRSRRAWRPSGTRAVLGTSHIGGYGPELGQWGVAWGIFDEKFWQLAFHGCAKSAGGGGSLVPWLPKVASAPVPHVSLGSRDTPNVCEPSVGLDGKERLRVECACGGVSFFIVRPTREMIEDEYMGDYVVSPSPTDGGSGGEDDNKNYKWKAFLDMCRDCGRLTGTTVVPWILVPRIATTEPQLPPDFQGVGTLKTYSSTPGRVTRGFCGRCGATVLLGTTKRTPSEQQAVLNIAMGLLRAPEGVTAEQWTVWRTGNVAFANDAREYDAEFTDALVSGIRNWGVETHGEAVDYAVI
ncbi:hypothetical protein G7054_g4222 [Neopestalotiopsis clavispora]|nr:hypothetical protein G7054_g4222 [Neopestalotiopsis clavispora]